MKRSTRRIMTVSAAAAGFALLSAGSALAQPNQGPGDIEQAPNNPIYVTVGNVHGAEGDAGTKLLPVVVKLSKASANPHWVQVKTADGPVPAAKAGSDYQAIALATLHFAPGQTQKVFNVIVKGDLIDEKNENVSVNVTGKSAGLSVLDPTGNAMITDDDELVIAPPPKDDGPDDDNPPPADPPQGDEDPQPEADGQPQGGGGGVQPGGSDATSSTVPSTQPASGEQALGANDAAGIASDEQANQPANWLFVTLLVCLAGIAVVLTLLARRRRQA